MRFRDAAILLETHCHAPGEALALVLRLGDWDDAQRLVLQIPVSSLNLVTVCRLDS
jgi:hypothetical protein